MTGTRTDPLAPRRPDPASPVPRWAQVEADLRRRLGTGGFAGRFPTEGELVDQYEVSRGTVRQALQRLRQDGLLESRQGAGTFVVDPSHLDDTYGIPSLALTLRAMGVDESNIVRAVDVRPAGPAAEPLDVGSEDPVVFVERVRLGDGEPLAIDRSWLPADLARPLLEADLRTGSLYGALLERCGVRVTGGHEHVRPARPDPADRRALHLPPSEAVFAVERVALAGDRPVELRHSVMRGDRYELLARWGSRPGRFVEGGGATPAT